MIKLRYETVPYNDQHGAWNPANCHRDMDEAFAGKPEEALKYLLYKLDEIEAKLKVIRMAQERKQNNEQSKTKCKPIVDAQGCSKE